MLTPNVVQEVQAGYYEYFWRETLAPGVAATPSYGFGVITIGPSDFYPENFNERTPSVHYQVSVHHGKHDFKFGAEGLFRTDAGFWPLNARGSLSINVPTDIPLTSPVSFGGLEQCLSVESERSWSAGQQREPGLLSARAPASTCRGIPMRLWAGDTYHPFKNLTINLGLRWDVDLGQYNPPGFTPTTVLVNNGWGTNGNVGIRNGVVSWHDIAPRGGFSWAVGKGFVIRGGAGVFYSVHDSQLTLGLDQQGGENVFANTYNNPTKNPDFINNWTQGATAATYVANPSLLPPQAFSSVAPDMRDPRAVQATAGVQKQIGSSWVCDFRFDLHQGRISGRVSERQPESGSR